MKDTLGDRMKTFYEDRTRYKLQRRTYTIIRIDGKAFHTYTKGLEKPFDEDLMEDMDQTAAYLCANIQGAKFAFVQSDEISIVLTDFDDLTTNAWFDYNLQKMCSISASLATAKFNELRRARYYRWWGSLSEEENYIIQEQSKLSRMYCTLALFDARVFQLPTKREVENYFIWRQQDTVRNSISSVAQSLYSHKELEKKNTSDLQEMIFQKGINWNDYAPRFKRGRIICKEKYEKEDSIRTRWSIIEPPTFTQDRSFLQELIPINE